MTKNNARFATRLGIIAATVGSSVGLGNIWRFPYEAGVHGGGAFLMIYLVCIVLLGVPVICAEFAMGRATHANIFGAFRALHPNRLWSLVGYIGILASILILSFYSVVAGWTVDFFIHSFTDEISPEHFSALTRGSGCVVYTLVFLLINTLVVMGGVQKGIERFSNILMPCLFVLLVVFAVNSLMMPGAHQGLAFLFSPDFSQITPTNVIGAMGQAFFSLSLGLGCMLTYASYFKDNTPIFRTSLTIISLDTLVALMAGIIIFPAVFTFGQEVAAGPKLVFEILPGIFGQLPGGQFWSGAFFFLLFLASLTSTISMSEIGIAFLQQQWHMSRRRAVLSVSATAIVLGTACALAFGPWKDVKIFGLDIFNLFDYVSSNICLPLGGMLISIFAAWCVDRRFMSRQLAKGEHLPPAIVSTVVFLLRYVAPVAIAVIFIYGLS